MQVGLSSKTWKQIPLDSINLWSEDFEFIQMWCVWFCVFVGRLVNQQAFLNMVPNPIRVPKSFLKHERSIPVIQSFHFYPNLQEDISRFQLINDSQFFDQNRARQYWIWPIVSLVWYLQSVSSIPKWYQLSACHWDPSNSFVWKYPKSSRHILENIYPAFGATKK